MKYQYSLLLLFACPYLFTFPPALASAAESRPNILFIHMEDMGCEIPPYGDTVQETPALSRLAAEGMVFERAHVTAASCAPSRGSLFTGLYPHQNGIWAFINTHGFHYREGVKTFVPILKDQGYRTGITYKTGVEPEKFVPFDYKKSLRHNPYEPGRSDATVTNFIDQFQYFLETQPKGQPFYFQAQTGDTHQKWPKPGSIRGVESTRGLSPLDPSAVGPLPHMGSDAVLDTAMRKHLAAYYGAIQRVDYFVDKILRLLDDAGHADNTLVILSADHGPSGLGYNCGKTSPYEFGLRVPFIVRWPGVIEPGSRSDALVSFVDLLPTFLEVAGADEPAGVAGHSIVPVLKGEQRDGVRKYLFSAYNAHTTSYAAYWPTRTICDGRFKLIHNLLGDGQRVRGSDPDGQRPKQDFFALGLRSKAQGPVAAAVAERRLRPPTFELYDLQVDPGETVDLAGQPEHQETLRNLQEELSRWQANTKDPLANPATLEEFTGEYYQKVAQWTRVMKEKGKEQLGKEKWKLDMERWLPAWSPDGQRKDPWL